MADFEKLFDKIESIENVGEKKAKLLQKTTGGGKVIDLIFDCPREYLLWHNKKVSDLVAGERVCINAVVSMLYPQNHRNRRMRYSGVRPWRISMEDETGKFEIRYFQISDKWVNSTFEVGKELTIYGKIDEKSFTPFVINHPYKVSRASVKKSANISAIYRLTAGLNRQSRAQAQYQAMSILPDLDEWIDQNTLAKGGWSSWRKSLFELHYPPSLEEAEKAKERLAYDELFARQIFFKMLKMKEKTVPVKAFPANLEAEKVLERSLPFELTGSQKNAIAEIRKDLSSGERMSRLLQGDVGSGKTLVMLFSALQVAQQEGWQTAIMAPSEILARQHYETLSKFGESTSLKVDLLTGQMKSKERKIAEEKIKTGKTSIVIGTHALISSNTDFYKLGLVIVDEQHRFGVEQRIALTKKNKDGIAPHLLSVTATPIPRSAILTQYGSVDITELTEMPLGFRKVKMGIASMDSESNVLERVKSKLQEGKKIFWVCPAIDEKDSETLDDDDALFGETANKIKLSSVTERHKILTNFLPDFPIFFLHGKMKSKDQNQVMQEFIKPQPAVLVATSVIEVGIDVKDADIIIIEDAHRFGLAALHQLRGRVGRAGQDSSCLLLYKKPLNMVAQERLNILKASNDGFKIAEKDLELRGGGDIIGREQSGASMMRFFEASKHSEMLSEAHINADRLLNNDPELTSEKGKLAYQLLRFFGREKITSDDILKA